MATNELWLKNKHCRLSGDFTHFFFIFAAFFHLIIMLILFSTAPMPLLAFFYYDPKKHMNPLYARHRRRSTDRLCLGLSGWDILCFTGEIWDLVSETHPPGPHSYNWKKTKHEGITELIIHLEITCQCFNSFIVWQFTFWGEFISATPERKYKCFKPINQIHPHVFHWSSNR